MSGFTEYLRRAAAPRTVVAISRWRWPRRWRAAVRRVLGLRPCIELYFAFDDPYAAIALPGLIRIAQARNAELKLFPLLQRGIDGDPAAQQRRLHAVTDSARLAAREGRQLQRRTPLAAQDSAFLAEWSAAAQTQAGVSSFAAAALEQLWFHSGNMPQREAYTALCRRHLGDTPDGHAAADTLARNHARLLRLGHWESPAARVDGEWFFAHERLAQIDARLLAVAA